MIDAKEYGVRKLDDASIYLVLEQMRLRDSEIELWTAMNEAILILSACKKLVLNPGRA